MELLNLLLSCLTKEEIKSLMERVADVATLNPTDKSYEALFGYLNTARSARENNDTLTAEEPKSNIGKR